MLLGYHDKIICGEHSCSNTHNITCSLLVVSCPKTQLIVPFFKSPLKLNLQPASDIGCSWAATTRYLCKHSCSNTHNITCTLLLVSYNCDTTYSAIFKTSSEIKYTIDFQIIQLAIPRDPDMPIFPTAHQEKALSCIPQIIAHKSMTANILCVHTDQRKQFFLFFLGSIVVFLLNQHIIRSSNLPIGKIQKLSGFVSLMLCFKVFSHLNFLSSWCC